MENKLIKFILVSAVFCQTIELNSCLAKDDSCTKISKETLRAAVKRECPGKKYDGIHYGWPSRCVAGVAKKLRRECKEKHKNYHTRRRSIVGKK